MSSEHGTKQISISLLPLITIAGLAAVGYALGGLLGLGIALLIIPASYVVFIVGAWMWAK